MKKEIKYVLSAIGEHFLYALISVVLMFILGAMFKKCLWVVSIITALLYLSTAYSSGWTNAGRDFRAAKALAREKGSEEIEFHIWRGFVYPLGLLAVSVVFLILNVIFGSYFTIIFRIYNFAFVFFLDTKLLPRIAVEIIITVLPYILYGLGYIAGKDKKVFISKHLYKLIYKTKKDEQLRR